MKCTFLPTTFAQLNGVKAAIASAMPNLDDCFSQETYYLQHHESNVVRRSQHSKWATYASIHAGTWPSMVHVQLRARFLRSNLVADPGPRMIRRRYAVVGHFSSLLGGAPADQHMH